MNIPKKRFAKRIVICLTIAAALAAAGVGGYALYGKAQAKKIPGLTAKEALEYTLRQNENGVITVGTIQNGKMSYTVYGENGVEIDRKPHTYEIGSLTKTFTAAMVCTAVQEGKLSLDASLDAYLPLPEGHHYPTIRQLLTHTSGYKAYYFEGPMISNFFKGRNDFYGIGDSMVLSRLAKNDMADSAYGFTYSNFGYAALGLVLEEIYQTEYTTLINDFAQNKLGLAATHISDGNGDLGNNWDWMPGDAYMSAGALTSDIEDMLQYAKLQLGRTVCGDACLEPLKEIHASTSAYKMLGIRMDEIAYGWIIDAENNIIWHNGGTGGYNCYVGLDTQNKNAVVVLSNLAPGYRIPATVIGIKALTEMRNGGQ
ncbi:MAG: serine hydrolase domain-containing protein [Oscillibacter sp.]|nr:serine hydrolase domain-containing protein [Oscillibacter sp.]